MLHTSENPSAAHLFRCAKALLPGSNTNRLAVILPRKRRLCRKSLCVVHFSPMSKSALYQSLKNCLPVALPRRRRALPGNPCGASFSHVTLFAGFQYELSPVCRAPGHHCPILLYLQTVPAKALSHGSETRFQSSQRCNGLLCALCAKQKRRPTFKGPRRRFFRLYFFRNTVSRCAHISSLGWNKSSFTPSVVS